MNSLYFTRVLFISSVSYSWHHYGTGTERALVCIDVPLKPISQLRFDYDTTAIRLRHDYDEKLTCSFFARVKSRGMEAGARDTSYSRIAVESNANRNFSQFRRSRMRRGIVVS